MNFSRVRRFVPILEQYVRAPMQQQQQRQRLASLRLFHFNRVDRAEPIRLALTIANIPFDDVRISTDNWRSMKDETPLGLLPVLEVDGERFAQANALLRYVGRLGGLMPTDPIQALQVDQIIGAVDDLIYAIIPTLHTDDPQLKLQQRSSLAADTIPFMFQRLEQVVGNESPHFAVGNDLTIADLVLYNTLHWFKTGKLEGIPSEIGEGCEKLCKIYETVAKNDRVMQWYEHHGR